MAIFKVFGDSENSADSTTGLLSIHKLRLEVFLRQICFPS